jgi:hypothetical protein
MDLELLKLAADEEHKALEAHQARVQFISGLLSALVAADIAGLLQAKSLLHYAALAVGPIAIIALARLGCEVSWQFYHRFLRSVTMRAKLEQRLGLTATSVDAPLIGYWAREPIVPTSHIESRARADDSRTWIETKRGTGYDGSARRLFTMFSWLAVALFALTVVSGASVYLKSPGNDTPVKRITVERGGSTAPNPALQPTPGDRRGHSEGRGGRG